MENNNKLSPQNQANNIDEDLVDPRDMQANIELDLWLGEDIHQQPTTPPEATSPPTETDKQSSPPPVTQSKPTPRFKREKISPLFDESGEPKQDSIYLKDL